MPRSSSSVTISGRSETSNTPSTVARSAPLRMRSVLARSPSSRPSAPTMIDLPAPVSPDSTLKPRASGRVSDSMIAKFLMRSSVSMSAGIGYRTSAALAEAYRTQPEIYLIRRRRGDPGPGASVAFLQSSPPQLVPQAGEEGRARKTHDRHRVGSAAHRQGLSAGEGRADLAVDRHQKLL